MGIVGEWREGELHSNIPSQWQIMYIAKSFSVSPLEIESAWDYMRFRYALDYLNMTSDYETAKAGWEIQEMELAKPRQF